ncbi:DUF3093 domain-containing protein [Microbacterium sp. A196]|uniref:DUF3093 domain-containing protein n=1 Tax=unclassified Microbacterium TaxID=2609290 RepID=UPI003FD4B4C9
MQNHDADTRVRYRERLSPSLWMLVAAAVVAPMAMLVFTPIGALPGLLIGAALALAVILAMIFGSPRIRIEGTTLYAGRAKIDAHWLGEVVEYTGEEARAARGPKLAARGWHLLRGGIDGIVVVQNTDPDDPIPSWTISTRTPDRLAAAIRAAEADAA